jgi:transcriptional regulator GlxA family with amidase domain
MEPVTTMGGIRMVPEVLISNIRPVPEDVLILPCADTWLNPEQGPVIGTVRDLLDHGTVVAAICGATPGLACAGLLDNRPHTSNDPVALKMFCPTYRGERHYVNEPAVTDDNLITASGLAPLEFAYQVFKNDEPGNPGSMASTLYDTKTGVFLCPDGISQHCPLMVISDSFSREGPVLCHAPSSAC